jgi:hypothetical protein
VTETRPRTIRTLARTLKTVTDAGLSVHRIEIDPNGRIVIVTGTTDSTACDASRNEWDAAPTGETRQ